MVMLRSHTCGELRKKHVGQSVTLTGWVHSIRHHGSFFFLDLRDRYGITQLIADESLSDLEDISRESVIQVKGEVKEKPEENTDIKTGSVEVSVESFSVITHADPIPIDEDSSLDTKLKWRYLDIRQNPENLVFRHRFNQACRSFLDKEGFIDIETPLLVRATPEGARDYVVPSRVHKGSGYALPQSPQLYKQLLMVGGIDKYYQFAKCLRDEDLRADRQPEFTQIDLEMSFVEQEDVFNLVEDMIVHAVEETKDISLGTFPRMTFEEAMKRYGSDKPDIRFGYELQDVTEQAHESDLSIFSSAEHVVALPFDKAVSRSQIKKLEKDAKEVGAKGLAYVKNEEGELTGPISKFLDDQTFIDELGLGDGDIAFFAADRREKAQAILGHVRIRLRDMFDLAPSDELAFVWVTDFPLFEWDEDEERWLPAHHVFTMPKEEHISSFTDDPRNTLSQSYDLALNGIELGSGSIRVSDPDLQKELLDFIGISESEAEDKFGFLLEAYNYGAPVHGGFAVGIDRLLALLTGKNDIRNVIAFPKNKQARSPMDGSPTPLDKETLETVGLKKK